ncbi:MAG: 50S ribosomal protein L4 [Candidatus Saccharimonadales bacterium]
MAQAITFTKTGAKATKQTTLPKELFDHEVKSYTLLRQAYEAYEHNGRSSTARVKTRGEVRGGGRKPWRQKGTGNARAGSIRSPIWRGGGITFGPTGEENYTKKLNTTAKRRALTQALSLKAAAKSVYTIETIELKENKTKELAQLLAKLDMGRRIIVVVENKTPELTRAANNLPEVSLMQASYLNVKTVLDADGLLFVGKAMEVLATQMEKK